MAKKTKTEEIAPRDVINVTDLKVGDIIYLTKEDNKKYTVLDVGNPFILVEGPDHFASLYRVVDSIYKDIV